MTPIAGTKRPASPICKPTKPAKRGPASVEEEAPVAPICAICLDEVAATDGERLRPHHEKGGTVCGHTFHKNCLRQYAAMTAGVDAACPACRTPIDEEVVDDLLPPILPAILEGDSARLKRLLDDGADGNIRFHDGSALAIAAEIGDADVVGVLLAAGVDVHATNPKTGTPEHPLERACYEGNAHVVDMLLNAGADVNANSWALRSACKNGHHDVVLLLIARGVDVACHGGDALIWAAHTGNTKILELLLVVGLRKFASQTLQGALDCAAIRGNLEALKVALQFGISPNGGDGHSLRRAAEYSSYEVVKTLLDAGASVVGLRGEMALYSAAKTGKLECVKAMVEAGASVSARKNIALRAAISNHHEDVVAFFLAKGAVSSGVAGHVVCATES